MFPISDSIKSNRFPIATLLMIAANLFVFSQQLFSPNQSAFIQSYALIPAEVTLLNLESLLPFATSLFLHGGFLHIAVNMWFLWVFGDNVEAHLGKIKYVLLYLLAGIGGNLLQFALSPGSSIPILGASGAISGVLGSYVILFPRASIKTFVILFFFITITEIPAMIYIFYWFIIQLFSGIASLPFAFQSGGVAFWAHVGGFVAGIYLTKKLTTKGSDIIEGEIIE